MDDLFTELKRRNVFKVGVAYLALGWVVIQVTSMAVPALNLPDNLISIVFYLGIVGFPFALLFAWAFELTPEGIKRSHEVEEDQSVAHITGRKLDFFIIGALIFALGYFVWERQEYAPAAADINRQKIASIAVLPFVNMSSDQEHEYFSDGISEEILNVLVRIPQLKVAGRTSSFAFKGKNQDLRNIGKSLNVNHILEGSVRRSGNRLRITAQLIRSEDGFHLWSETYDRELADVFDIQDEISRSIADQLAVSLGLGGGSLVVDRTADLEAYEKYMRAHQLVLKRGEENLRMAALLFVEVTARDPNFAPAWTGLASVYSVLESYVQPFSIEERLQWRTLGTHAAKRAIQLNPRSGEAYSVLGSFYVYKMNQWQEAIDAFDKAIELSPDNSSVFDIASQSYLEVGYFKKAEALSKRAVELDPLVAIYRVTYARTMMRQGKQNDAIQMFESAAAVDSSLIFSFGSLLDIYLTTGQFDKALSTLSRANAAGHGFADDSFIQSVKKAYGNADAMKALRDSEKGYEAHLLSYMIADWEAVLENTILRWEREGRTNTNLFRRQEGLYSHPRWKEQVRKDGIYDLWLARGFPAHCRPLGEDDFECGPEH